MESQDILDKIYRLKPNITTIPFRDEGLQILAYGREFILKGQVATVLLPALLKLLDGRKTVAQILQEINQDLEKPIPEKVMTQTIVALERKSLIVECRDDAGKVPPGQQAQREFFAIFEKDVDKYLARLQQAHLGIFAIGEVTPLVKSCASLGIGKISVFHLQNTPCALNIPNVTCYNLDDFSPATLDRLTPHGITHCVAFASALTTQLWDNLNSWAIASGISMSRIELSPLSAEIGPTTVPGRTACYRCYDLRRQSLKVHYDEYKNLAAHLESHNALTPYTVHPLLLELTCNMAAYEIMRLISGYLHPQTYNQVLSIGFFGFEVDKNVVLKLPRCPVCGPQQPPREKYQRIFAGESTP